MVRKLLFVDDEPKVLEGLRRMLRPLRDEWDMAFARGGPEALQLLGRDAFDVVVTDMRMPDMDGAELLAQVRGRQGHWRATRRTRRLWHRRRRGNRCSDFLVPKQR